MPHTGLSATADTCYIMGYNNKHTATTTTKLNVDCFLSEYKSAA